MGKAASANSESTESFVWVDSTSPKAARHARSHVAAGDLKTVKSRCAGYVTNIPLALGQIEYLFDLVGDPSKPVQQAATGCLAEVASKMPKHATRQYLRGMTFALSGLARPEQKELALQILAAFCATSPDVVGQELVNLVPLVSSLITDLKVSKLATETMGKLFATCGNQDLMRGNFLRHAVDAASNHHVGESVETLAGCVFVQKVESPALAVMIPLLERGLKDRSDETARLAAKIIANMCDVVDQPREAFPLLPRVLPLARARSDQLADPEAREMVARAVSAMEKFERAGGRQAVAVRRFLGKAMPPAAKKLAQDADLEKFMQNAVVALTFTRCQDAGAWEAVVKYVGLGAGEARILMQGMLQGQALLGDEELVFSENPEDEKTPDLFRGAVQLAFGCTTILRESPLLLKKNRFYALLGRNGCGKTALLRAIADGKLQGFPGKDKLRCVFVEHDIPDEEVPSANGRASSQKSRRTLDLSGAEWVHYIVNTSYNCIVKMQDVEKALTNAGFARGSPADFSRPLVTYSGGWKLKMQLAAAQLASADILLLDEPTGHMDTANQKWMRDWLSNFAGSKIVISHDHDFINSMATDLLYFDDKKLRQWSGSAAARPSGSGGKKGARVSGGAGADANLLARFVVQNPQMSFLQLTLTSARKPFEFPAPGPLDGVKSKTKAIVKMQNVCFKYKNGMLPPKAQYNVSAVSLNLCLCSRVAVVGKNGAGKSTVVKLITGELSPTKGLVTRQSGTRVAYVAQQALFHLDKHLEMTPRDYFFWRFQGMDDQETQELVSARSSVNYDADKLKMVGWCVDLSTGRMRLCQKGPGGDKAMTPEALISRRRNQKEHVFEYEVKWVEKDAEHTTWVRRPELVQMGYEQWVCREDEQQAAEKGLMFRPLTQAAVEQHLAGFGLGAEQVSHTSIGKLAAGEKIRVVLAAASWLNPHVLILDEPTNYLDRAGLAALIGGLKRFGGGVVLVSHSEEFVSQLATETWRMSDAGELKREGVLAETQGPEVFEGQAVMEDLVDAFGNSISPPNANNGSPSSNPLDVSKGANVVRKSLKKQIRELDSQLKKKRNSSGLTEDFKSALKDKIADLRNQLDVLEGKMDLGSYRDSVVIEPMSVEAFAGQ